MSDTIPPPPGAPAKKGLPTIAWVGIGCAGILFVGLVASVALGVFAFRKGSEAVQEATGSSFGELIDDMKTNPAKTAAEVAVRLNPDLELVSSDDEAGTLTVRNSRTGEEATLNFEDIAEGRFSMSGDAGDFAIEGGAGGVTVSGPDGETRFGAAADAGDVPDWVPVYPGMTGTQSLFSTSTATGSSGAFSAKSTDSAQSVHDHYLELLEAAGHEVTSQSMTTTGQGAVGTIAAELDEGRSLNVAIVEQQAGTQVTINYAVKQR